VKEATSFFLEPFSFFRLLTSSSIIYDVNQPNGEVEKQKDRKLKAKVQGRGRDYGNLQSYNPTKV
jgi:hypothetical protein